jgi:hypothetical protein
MRALDSPFVAACTAEAAAAAAAAAGAMTPVLEFDFSMGGSAADGSWDDDHDPVQAVLESFGSFSAGSPQSAGGEGPVLAAAAAADLLLAAGVALLPGSAAAEELLPTVSTDALAALMAMDVVESESAGFQELAAYVLGDETSSDRDTFDMGAELLCMHVI